MKRGRKRDTFVCPHCGADVAANSPVCRECGSDAETGWSEDADKWGTDIPAGYGSEDDFDYDEFVEQELPQHPPLSSGRLMKRWGWRLLVAIACLSLLSYCFLR
ncbi:MAG TPA: hypothetical protein VKF17_05985 [Isosphaeraceae bacterium]|nr:hypothetical protein [Isosphaeraceae bacterium]HMF36167.1 hypothetical protein [Isosphaeraceae bacterium]